MLAISFTIACSRYIYNGVILDAHPVRGESHNQRNTTGEVATTSSPFYNETQSKKKICININYASLKQKISCLRVQTT